MSSALPLLYPLTLPVDYPSPFTTDLIVLPGTKGVLPYLAESYTYVGGTGYIAPSTRCKVHQAVLTDT